MPSIVKSLFNFFYFELIASTQIIGSRQQHDEYQEKKHILLTFDVQRSFNINSFIEKLRVVA